MIRVIHDGAYTDEDVDNAREFLKYWYGKTPTDLRNCALEAKRILELRKGKL